MLLSEKKVWKIVTGEQPRSMTVAEHEAANVEKGLPKPTRKWIQKDFDDWDDGNEEALRIISFMVFDQLQGPIRSAKASKDVWDELQRVHAPTTDNKNFRLCAGSTT